MPRKRRLPLAIRVPMPIVERFADASFSARDARTLMILLRDGYIESNLSEASRRLGIPVTSVHRMVIPLVALCVLKLDGERYIINENTNLWRVKPMSYGTERIMGQPRKVGTSEGP